MIKSFLYKYYARLKRRRFIADQRKKGNLISNESKGFMKVVYGGENAIPEGCSFSGKITLGFRTTLGINNMFFGKVTLVEVKLCNRKLNPKDTSFSK